MVKKNKWIEEQKKDNPLNGALISDVNICETAGFVDLETRFKRMEQAGYVAQFFSNQFDTSEIRDIFMGEDSQIYADDDEDTVMEKLILQEKKRQKYMEKFKLGDLAEANDRAEAPQGSGSSEGKPSSQNVKQETSNEPTQKDK